MIRILFVLLFFSPFCLIAQSLPVGTPALEDAYRRAQLLGQIDSSISFVSKPFYPVQSLGVRNAFDPDSSLAASRNNSGGILRFAKGLGKFQVLPINWQQQINTHHPEGINDGAMIPSKGYQTLFSAGVFASYGPLSIQLQPEAVYAANKTYDGFPTEFSDKRWADYYNIVLNKIDLPEQFGPDSYKKVFWGQSSVRINFGALSAGVSSENLWWGPGMRNSLLMSNNAPGFKHLTFNTRKPVKTFIGSFEGQIIAGKLDGSGFNPPSSERTYLGTNIYKPKSESWRYLNGMVLSYQPKWVPGLFLGLTRSFQVYREDMGNGFTDYFPLLSAFEKKNTGEVLEDSKKRDQLASVFMRWVWPEAHGEIYFEYGRNDHSYDLRDVFLEPEHSRAYILGLRKLFPLTLAKDHSVMVNLEMTQLELTNTSQTRPVELWYAHYQVRHGYTHKGQVLGAGIGPGSNLQSLQVSYVNQLNSLGFTIERYVHNNDFHYGAVKDLRSHWVDLKAGLQGTWNLGNFMLNARTDLVRSFNYQHQYDPIPSNPPAYWDPGKTVFNFSGAAGFIYRF
ncbi:capsule assembly Wzi family protein [Daejeonella oryzae]|uniref:capsule assembly Wzi family protein n=1 Tax=Daejeonella oryzae TaxID=1122943 RepID=UPI000424102D|nr:capsule assembly Wzi family protein [Daejeonella oryzae]